jgi:hypothetical protein
MVYIHTHTIISLTNLFVGGAHGCSDLGIIHIQVNFLHAYVHIQRDMFSFLVGQAMLVYMYTYMYTHMHNTWMHNKQHRSSASQRIDHN